MKPPKRFSEDAVAVVARIVMPSTCNITDAERLVLTRQMIEDLEVLAYHYDCMAAAWALAFIRKVTE